MISRGGVPANRPRLGEDEARSHTPAGHPGDRRPYAREAGQQ